MLSSMYSSATPSSAPKMSELTPVMAMASGSAVAPPNFPFKPVAFAPAPSAGGRKKVNPLKAVLSGGLAGGIEICVTYPTEFVKTQLQLDSRAATPKYTGAIDCAKKTVARSGVGGLYRGLSSLLAGSIPKASVRFAAYEQFAGLLMDKEKGLSRSGTLMAGLGAGVTEAFLVVCPMETVKVKMIHDQNRDKPRYRNLVHATRTILKEEGLVNGIYAGITATVLKQGSNQAIRFFTFGEVKHYFIGDRPKSELAVWQSLIAGGIAGGASVLGNNPLDVVKTRMQGLEAAKYKNTWHCFTSVLKDDGFMGFYKGSGPRMTRVVIDVALVMTLYQEINKLLEMVPFLRDYE